MGFSWKGYKRMYNENMPSLLAEGNPGYSRIDFALAYASWMVHDVFAGGFIRNLGYEAIQCGNDTALSIPLAIDAGLGELGRNGLLITPDWS